MGGKSQGFISAGDFFNLTTECLPSCFDKGVLLEMFREVDSDKDGRLTYKDFNDCLKFQI